jgi:hypothetical protein
LSLTTRLLQQTRWFRVYFAVWVALSAEACGQKAVLYQLATAIGDKDCRHCALILEPTVGTAPKTGAQASNPPHGMEE